MVQALRDYGGSTYEFVGYFDDNHPTPETRPVSDLLKVNEEVGVHQIVLANPDQRSSLLRVLSICHERGIQVTPMFALYQDLTGRVPVSHLGKDWFVALPANIKATVRTYMVVKRAFDLLLAFGIQLVTAPLIPLIALT